MPAPGEANAIGAKAAAKQGHGAACAGAVGREVARVEIRVWESGDRATQEGSDVGGEDEVPLGTEKTEGIEWRRGVGASVVELQNAARQ